MKSAKDTVAEERVPVVNPLLQLDQPRFFVQMGWDVLTVDTDAIPNRRLLRGEITPARSFQAKENIANIIPGELIPGSQETDPAGVQVLYGKYWRRAKYEADRLVANEAASEFKTGLVEIASLRNVPQIYDQFDITQLIFRDTWPNLPDRNSDVLLFLQEQLADLPNREIPGLVRPIVEQVYREMIGAVGIVDRIQNERLQLTHNRMKLSPLEPGAKHAYDAVDREMLTRTGLPEIYSTDVSIARTLELMQSQRGAVQSASTGSDLSDALALISKVMAEQAETQRLLTELLSKNQASGSIPPLEAARRK